MTVMGDTAMNRLSDRGSTPLSSMFSFLAVRMKKSAVHLLGEPALFCADAFLLCLSIIFCPQLKVCLGMRTDRADLRRGWTIMDMTAVAADPCHFSFS